MPVKPGSNAEAILIAVVCATSFSATFPPAKVFLQNFANAILYGEELIAPGGDGINELMLSNSAYLSSWNDGAEIALPMNEQDFDKCMSELRSKSVYYKEQQYKRLPDGEYSHSWQVHW